MSVWLVLPSAKPDGGTIPLWKEKGYKIAVWRDPGVSVLDVDYIHSSEYPGYYRACNHLIRYLLNWRCHWDWVVCGADDTLPDPRDPETIAAECRVHFADLALHDRGAATYRQLGTFGVMQPTGDPWACGLGRIIDRIAGSPWIGREFAKRAYQGMGPYWSEYFHMGGDEELKCVAEKLGVYWPRRDVTHLHQRWDRRDDNYSGNWGIQPPDYMAKAYGPEEWANYERVFKTREAAGFPGHEPI